MRRTILLLTLMATATLLLSGMALAINKISCPNRADNLFGNLCIGTNDPDAMSGTTDADDMRGLEGDDVIRAEEDSDRLVGGKGDDRLSGNSGDDRYAFADGWGKDAIVSDGSGQHDKVGFYRTTTGVKIALDDQHPSIELGASAGQNSTVDFAANVIENAAGGSGSDRIAGSSSDNRLRGNRGNDSLQGADGNDYLNGGADDDALMGGLGDDAYGGYGAGSGHDVIVDDASGSADRLNLGEHSSSSATFRPLDGTDSDENYDALSIALGGGDTVLIHNYFDNTRSRVSVSGPGTGLIEKIVFSDKTLGFSEVKDLIASGEVAPPVATDDDESTNEDTPVVIDVLANDTGQNLSVKASSLGDPAHGTATLITADGPEKGKVRYTPDADYNGSDTFTYEACDDIAPPECDQAAVRLTVNPANDVPLSEDGTASMEEDGAPIQIDLGALVSDVETSDADLTYTIVSGPTPAQGTLTDTGPTFTFDSADDYNGTFDITYTVTDRGDPDNCGIPGAGCEAPKTSAQKKVAVTVTSVNFAPSVNLIGGPTGPVEEGNTTYTFDFTVSDDDPGDDFTPNSGFPKCGAGGELVENSLSTSASGGSFECRFADGPASPSVRMQVNDGEADSNVATAGPFTVENVKPTVALSGPSTVEESTTAERTYTFTVTDPGEDTFEVEQGFPTCGNNGTLVADSLLTDATGGSFECIFPDGDTTSNVAIQVKDSDGALDTDNQIVTVTVENEPPTATFNAPDSVDEGEDITVSLTGATDPAGDNDTIEYRFDCGSGFGAYGTQSTATCPTTDDGSVLVKGQVRDEDGGESEEYQKTVTVSNVAPNVTAANDQTSDEGTSESFNLGSFTDPGTDGDWSVSVDWGDGSTQAPFTTNQPGSLGQKSHTYSDEGNYTVTVTVAEAGGSGAPSGTDTFLVTVNNLPPTANAQSVQTNDGEAKTITLTGTDPGSDPLSFRITTLPTHGTLYDGADTTGHEIVAGDLPYSLSSTDKVTYEPVASYSGPDSFDFKADDGTDRSAAATVSITVVPFNDPPVANNGTETMSEDGAPINIDFGALVSDEETSDANLSFNITAPDAAKGTLSGTGSTRTFDSADNFNGTVEIPYTVTDRGSPDGCGTPGPACDGPETSSGKVTVTVTPVNDKPTASDSTTSMDEDAAPIQIDLGALVTDVETTDANLTYTIVSPPTSAQGTLTGTGSTRTFDSADNFFGEVTFTYKVTDRGDPDACGMPGAGCAAAKDSDTKTVTITVNPVNDAPVADDETFNGASRAVGNTSLVGNDPDDGAPDPSGPQKTISGDILSGDTDIDGPGPLIAQSGTFSTNDGGTVVIESDGDFTFRPKAGASCTDHSDFFDYTVSDQNSAAKPGTPGTDTGRVTIEIQDCVWYVDSSLGSNGDGRSNSPFNTLSAINGASGTGDADDASQKLFLYDGTYSGGLPLENSQTLFSQRHGLVVPDGGAGNITLEPAVPAGANSTITGGLTLAQDNTIQGIDLGNNASGAALSGSSVGTATMNTLTSGAVNNQSGKAVDISTGTLNMAFTGVSSNSSATDGIRLDNTAGTFNASGGSIQNATEQDVDISGNNSGDSVDFTYDGSITDDQGALVSVSGQTGGTKDFNGAITDNNDGDGSGISLTNNSGATVRFDGGLTLSTDSNAAFSATGGGTVVVTDPAGADNTITTTTGTALNVANTTIGSDGLTFKSISAGPASGTGPTNGIVLNNTGTSGGLTITGNGNSSVGGDNSGGTIQNTTGAGISLTNTRGPSFNNMRIANTVGGAGISGTAVTNFGFTNGTVTNSGFNSSNVTVCATAPATAHCPFDSNIAFNSNGETVNNVDGAVTITNNVLSNAYQFGVDVLNNSGTISDLNVSNNAITSPTTAADTAGSGLRIQALGSASTVASITKAELNGNDIKNFPNGAGIVVQGGNVSSLSAPSGSFGTSSANPVQIDNNLIHGQSATNPMSTNCILVTMPGRGTGFVAVSSNGTVGTPLGNNKGNCVSINATGAYTLTATVNSNVVSPGNGQNSGAFGIAGGTDKQVLADTTTADSAVMNLTANSNTVSNSKNSGIRFLANSRGTLNAKIQNNNIGTPDTGASGPSEPGIRLDSGTSVGTAVDTNVCLNISGNTTAGSTFSGTTFPGIGMRKQGTVATTNDFGIVGLSPSPATAAQTESYVSTQNPASTSGTFGTGGAAVISGSNFVNCTLGF